MTSERLLHHDQEREFVSRLLSSLRVTLILVRLSSWKLSCATGSDKDRAQTPRSVVSCYGRLLNIFR
jgi:hypothetical protein